jgi:hypothetical protein
VDSSRPLPPDIVDLVESGATILVGSRDGRLRPSCARGFGALVSGDRRHVTISLPQKSAGRVKADLDDNGRIAVGFSRPTDNLSVQLKGRCTEIRAAAEVDRYVPERYLVAYAEQLYLVGMPRSTLRRALYWPAWSVTFGVDDVFLQTPGPDAGKRLA